MHLEYAVLVLKKVIFTIHHYHISGEYTQISTQLLLGLPILALEGHHHYAAKRTIYKAY